MRGEGQRRSRSESLTPDQLNARIGLRWNRLVRHFALPFGAMDIEVENGTIKTILPSPTFRPAELRHLATRLSVKM